MECRLSSAHGAQGPRSYRACVVHESLPTGTSIPRAVRQRLPRIKWRHTQQGGCRGAEGMDDSPAPAPECRGLPAVRGRAGRGGPCPGARSLGSASRGSAPTGRGPRGGPARRGGVRGGRRGRRPPPAPGGRRGSRGRGAGVGVPRGAGHSGTAPCPRRGGG